MRNPNSRRTGFTKFAVFVPVGSDHWGIHPRSAIVANLEQLGNDELLVYFEGGLHADNLRRYSDRVMVAAGRQSERYPTVARSFIPAKALRQVGTFELATSRLHVQDRAALEAWLDGHKIE